MREVGRGANGERGSRARRGYRWGGAPIGLRVVVGGPCAALPSRVAFGCPPGAEVGDRRGPRGHVGAGARSVPVSAVA
jgi:hypothetical protein